MDKNGVVTFSDWNKGMVKHPIYGFGLLKNVEVFENKGIAKIKNRATPQTNITPTQLPIAECYDIYGNTYTLTGETGTGVCYKNGVVIQSGLSNAYDIKIYKNYLWCRYQTVLDAYGPLDSAGAAWFRVDTGYNTIGSTTVSYNAPILIGQDDYMYIGNGNTVIKKEVTSSGTVGVAPTVATSATLDLPDGQYVSCLEEYGTKIVMGTHGGGSYTDRGNYAIARLYSWNRQAGTLGNPGLADLPVIFSENGVNAIKQHANKLYVSAGTQGNVYMTDATNYVKIATIPYTQTGVNYNSTVYSNAITISARGNLLIGISGDLNSKSSTGIYEIDINDPAYPISYHINSGVTIGTESSPTQYKVGFVNSKNYQTIRSGWASGTTYGVDETDFRMYTSYGGIIETPMVKVGRFNGKKTFQHIEWCLAEPLVSGQNIRISYRINNKDPYKIINTWGFSTIGGKISFEDVAAIKDAEYVQLKIEMDQDLRTLYGSNINLVNVTLF